jgi:type IV pilus assembly protein PilA
VLADALKTAIAETHQAAGPGTKECTSAATCEAIGATVMDTGALGSNRNVDSVTSVNTGLITVTYKAAVVSSTVGNTIEIAPTATVTDAAGNATAFTDLSNADSAGGTISWSCTGGSVPAKYRPSACRVLAS